MADAGKLIILQSGGPTAVVNSSLVGAIRAARSAGVLGILGARFGMEGILASRYADLTGLPDARLDLLARTPGAALGSSRYRPDDAETERAVSLLVGQNVRWLVAIGWSTIRRNRSHRLHGVAQSKGAPLAVVAIPKTIDNDLPGMDHCPGYGSAARYLALAVREAAIDTAAMRRTDPIKIVEVMGRNAGWLAAAGALAREPSGDAPQVIFLPERPRSMAQMLEDVASAHRANGWAVVVISENQRDDEGRPPLPVVIPYTWMPMGIRTTKARAHTWRGRSSCTWGFARAMSAGQPATHLGRGDLGGGCSRGRDGGRRGGRLCLSDVSDQMVALQRAESKKYAVSLGTVPLRLVAHQERLLPDELIAESGVDVTQAFFDYAQPLIGGPLPPTFRLAD